MLLGIAFALLLAMMAGLTVFLLIGLGGYLWDQYPWATAAVLAAGGLASAVVLRRARLAEDAAGSELSARVHPGITMHAIPVAGGIGLVFTLGYLAMFWFGLPGLRPVVLALGGLGAVLGGILVFLADRRGPRVEDPTMLHLEDSEKAGRANRP
jgi:hypothetical protein